MIKKETILVPKYLEEFKCIGSACEDSCCIGWKVPIDEITYKKYKKIKKQPLKSMFEKNINRVRSNASAANFAKIKMDATGACPFLSEEKLCSIQLNLGESYLCTTCRVYPRFTKRLVSGPEMGGTISCPEIARLALLNKEKMEFSFVEGNIEDKQIRNTNQIEQGIVNNFWDIRVLMITILQNRDFSIHNRLIILGLLINKLSSMKNITTQDIIEKCNQYTKILQDIDGTTKDLEALTAKQKVQFNFIGAVLESRKNSKINHLQYAKILEQTLTTFDLSSKTEEEIDDLVKKISSKYSTLLFNKYEHVFENYLVNYVFKNSVGLENENIMDDYVLLVVHYALLKLHCLSEFNEKEVLEEKDLITIFQSFSKNIEHNSVFIQLILNYLHENKFNTLSFMTILIRN